jgi:hypothetical protein
MGEQLIQGLHRLRPVRRHGETLLLFLITSIDLSGLRLKGGASTFKQIASSYFTQAAAPKAERTRQSVINAIKALHLEGLPLESITTRRVAELAGVGRNTAHRQATEQDWGTFVESVIFSF